MQCAYNLFPLYTFPPPSLQPADAIAHSSSQYGTITDRPILLDEVFCTGTETRLVDCSYTSRHDCSHFEDAGVECNTTCKSGGYSGE